MHLCVVLNTTSQLERLERCLVAKLVMVASKSRELTFFIDDNVLVGGLLRLEPTYSSTVLLATSLDKVSEGSAL